MGTTTIFGISILLSNNILFLFCPSVVSCDCLSQHNDSNVLTKTLSVHFSSSPSVNFSSQSASRKRSRQQTDYSYYPLASAFSHRILSALFDMGQFRHLREPHAGQSSQDPKAYPNHQHEKPRKRKVDTITLPAKRLCPDEEPQQPKKARVGATDSTDALAIERERVSLKLAMFKADQEKTAAVIQDLEILQNHIGQSPSHVNLEDYHHRAETIDAAIVLHDKEQHCQRECRQRRTLISAAVPLASSECAEATTKSSESVQGAGREDVQDEHSEVQDEQAEAQDEQAEVQADEMEQQQPGADLSYAGPTEQALDLHYMLFGADADADTLYRADDIDDADSIYQTDTEDNNKPQEIRNIARPVPHCDGEGCPVKYLPHSHVNRTPGACNVRGVYFRELPCSSPERFAGRVKKNLGRYSEWTRRILTKFCQRSINAPHVYIDSRNDPRPPKPPTELTRISWRRPEFQYAVPKSTGRVEKAAYLRNQRIVTYYEIQKLRFRHEKGTNNAEQWRWFNRQNAFGPRMKAGDIDFEKLHRGLQQASADNTTTPEKKWKIMAKCAERLRPANPNFDFDNSTRSRAPTRRRVDFQDPAQQLPKGTPPRPIHPPEQLRRRFPLPPPPPPPHHPTQSTPTIWERAVAAAQDVATTTWSFYRH